MDVGGVIFAALIIVLAIPFAFEVRRKHGVERTLMTAALGAAVGLGVVNVVESLGWLADGPLYWTLNVSLVVLFWAMLFQVVRGKRGGTL